VHLEELGGHLEIGLELGDRVLVLVEQMLHFLLVHLDLHLSFRVQGLGFLTLISTEAFGVRG